MISKRIHGSLSPSNSLPVPPDHLCATVPTCVGTRLSDDRDVQQQPRHFSSRGLFEPFGTDGFPRGQSYRQQVRLSLIWRHSRTSALRWGRAGDSARPRHRPLSLSRLFLASRSPPGQLPRGSKECLQWLSRNPVDVPSQRRGRPVQRPLKDIRGDTGDDGLCRYHRRHRSPIPAPAACNRRAAAKISPAPRAGRDHSIVPIPGTTQRGSSGGRTSPQRRSR
jgi:hypothetical protein